MSLYKIATGLAVSLYKECTLYVYCQTCGKHFLTIKGKDYFKKSHVVKYNQPDKWFVETGIHWATTEGHLIIFEFKTESGDVLHQHTMNQIWDNKLKSDQTINPKASKEYQLPYFYKYRKQVSGQKI